MVEDKKLISIKVMGREYKKLSKYKTHPRQPFWEVIKNIIKEKEDGKIKK